MIEAPGKVIFHVHLLQLCLGKPSSTTLQAKFLYHIVVILTLGEDGELKFLNIKAFANPEKRGKVHGWVLVFWLGRHLFRGPTNRTHIKISCTLGT